MSAELGADDSPEGYLPSAHMFRAREIPELEEADGVGWLLMR